MLKTHYSQRSRQRLRHCVSARVSAHARVQAWTYDANNRLTQRGSSPCTSSGPNTGITCYDWDEAGNLTQKTEAGKTPQYRYDTQNRLIEVQDTTGGQTNPAATLIARYGYDPLDRRIWKEQYRDANGQGQGSPLAPALRTYYLYADEGLIAESTQAITLNADGSVSASSTPQISTQYGPRPDSEFTTGTLFVKTKNSNGQDTASPIVAYLHHDHLQTPLQATDKAGNVVWAASYNAFGKASITTPAATADKPTITVNLRLPGQYLDEETGLHYNWHRYYDGEIGRYVTQDPIGLRGDVNRFAYVGGNPLSRSDPTGLEPIPFPLVDDFFTGKAIACLEVEKQQWATWLRKVGDVPISQMRPSDWYIQSQAPREIAQLAIRQGNLIGKEAATTTLKKSGITGKSPNKQLGLGAMGLGMACGCN
jgi:RHS repeat-associated protein